jgi:hypothetical protein
MKSIVGSVYSYAVGFRYRRDVVMLWMGDCDRWQANQRCRSDQGAQFLHRVNLVTKLRNAASSVGLPLAPFFCKAAYLRTMSV